MLRIKKLTNNISDNRFLFYTFFSILLKCIIFLGFIMNSTHSSIDYISAHNRASGYLTFYCGFIIVFLSFSFLFKNRKRLWYLVGVNLFLSTLFLIDLWYYRGFETMPTIYLIKQTKNLDNLSDSIFSMMRWKDIIFIFDILLLIPISIKDKKIYCKAKRNGITFGISFILAFAYVSYIPFSVEILGKEDNKQIYKWYDSRITTSNLSPIGFHIYNLYCYAKDCRQLTLRPDEKKEIKLWFQGKNENIPDNKYAGMFKGKNLILVQLESFENFMINKSMNGQEITPNLNNLIKNSIYFSNVHEQVNEGTSSDGDLLANTSIYPLRVGSTFFRYPYTSYNSLPKLLKAQGYSTTAIHPDKGSFWNWKEALEAIGFEKCIDAKSFKIDEEIGLGLSDGSYFRQVRPYIQEQKQPFYTFMVTLSSHAPFDIPHKYKEITLDKRLDNTHLGEYFHSVHYTDMHIGRFIDNLKSDGLLQNSVIVFYGDHCGAHKYYKDELKELKNPEGWWIKNHKKIPLIIYQSNLKGEEIRTRGGQVDILPTVAYLMGIKENEYNDTAMGRNLLKTKKSFAVLNNKKIIEKDEDKEEDKIGEFSNKKEENEDKEAIKILNMADKLIRSNYFKK